MFCPNCGMQNTETALTCAKCNFQLKTAAAPKFKGTMLMMNQPGSIPGAPPRPGSSPGVAAPAPPAAGGAPASGSGFTAEAPPIGAGAPAASAAFAAPSRLKGTMVGVAPPSFGGPPSGGDAAPPAFGAPPPADAHQTFGSAADANPLAGTMALDGPPNFAHIPGAPVVGAAPAFGAPPPDAGGFNPPPFGAPPPDAGGGFAPPLQPGADPYGASPGGMGGPPQGGHMGGGLSPYGAPPGGDPYGAGAAPGGAGYGGLPGGPPPHQDYGAPMNAPMGPGFQQAGQQFGQAADQFGQQMGGGQMQPYQGGAPMMQQPGMGGMPGAMVAGGPPKQFMITLILALLPMFGIFGVHRFYTGHYLYGAIQFFTLGGCGVWQLIDIIQIATGKYTDSQGRPLVKS